MISLSSALLPMAGPPVAVTAGAGPPPPEITVAVEGPVTAVEPLLILGAGILYVPLTPSCGRGWGIRGMKGSAARVAHARMQQQRSVHKGWLCQQLAQTGLRQHTCFERLVVSFGCRVPALFNSAVVSSADAAARSTQEALPRALTVSASVVGNAPDSENDGVRDRPRGMPAFNWGAGARVEAQRWRYVATNRMFCCTTLMYAASSWQPLAARPRAPPSRRAAQRPRLPPPPTPCTP